MKPRKHALRPAHVQYSDTVQHSTVQYRTVQCSVVHYSAVQHSTKEYSKWLWRRDNEVPRRERINASVATLVLNPDFWAPSGTD